MPNRKKRARRRQGGLSMLLSALIAVLSLFAVVLLVLLLRSNPLAPDSGDGRLPYRYTSPIDFSEDDATPAPLVLGSAATPEPSDTPEPTPEPTATPEPDPDVEPEGETEADPDAEVTEAPAETEVPADDSSRLIPTPMPGDYFLPVFDRALRSPDDRAMIAVTIDDCDKKAAMAKIINIARRYGADLTLFPTGDALMKSRARFRAYVRLGHELENRAYDKDKLDYNLSDGELALQLWRQGIAASYVVNKDYQQHFYRPETRQSATDQRTHFFLRKLGLLGVASYTYSYLYHDLDYLVNSLANGNIYQFDMSDDSMALFESFLSEANRKGYKMVTMNELFGLEENEVGSKLTIDQQTLPGLEDYVPTLYDLKLNDRTRAVFTLQSRLMELGYIEQVQGGMVSDGIYGASTSIAVSAFQANVGLAATGDADVKTQELLFSEGAPAAEKPAAYS